MKSNTRSALSAGLAGGLIGALLVAAIPAFGAAGDNVRAGRLTDSGGYVTRLKGRGSPTLRLVNTSPGRPALELRVPTGTPPLAVDSTTRVNKLNADRVDGRHANSLIRVDYDHNDDVPDSPGSILWNSISAPRNGYLVVNASIEVGMNLPVEATAFVECYLRVDADRVPGSGRWANVFSQSGHPSGEDDICATTGVVPVPEGNHTVYLFIANVGGSGPGGAIELGEATMWTMFVPYDGQGGVPQGFIL